MEEAPDRIIEKLSTILFDENIPSTGDIEEMKRKLVPLMKAINHFETVQEKNSNIETIASARKLMAKAGVALALKSFARSDVVKKFS